MQEYVSRSKTACVIDQSKLSPPVDGWIVSNEALAMLGEASVLTMPSNLSSGAG